MPQILKTKTKKQKKTAMEQRKSYAQLEPVKKKKSTNKGFVIITIMLKARRKTARTQIPVPRFQKRVKEGPDYICYVCKRILYRKTATELQKNKYDIQHLFTGIKSFDDKEYICKTCNSKLS